MLIKNHKSQLGDLHLDPKENLAKLREENARLNEARKMFGQAELEDRDRSCGSRLSYREIIRRIQRANPGIRVQEGSEGAVALYILKSRGDEEDDGRGKSPKSSFFDDHRYVGGLRKEYLPEYGQITVDARGLPVREDPQGWRSVLIGLIKAGALTYQQAVQEFGEATGRRSNRWMQQLRNLK